VQVIKQAQEHDREAKLKLAQADAMAASNKIGQHKRTTTAQI
jgi:hypothetical protein